MQRSASIRRATSPSRSSAAPDSARARTRCTPSTSPGSVNESLMVNSFVARRECRCRRRPRRARATDTSSVPCLAADRRSRSRSATSRSRAFRSDESAPAAGSPIPSAAGSRCPRASSAAWRQRPNRPAPANPDRPVEHAHCSHPAEARTPVGTIESDEAPPVTCSKNRVVHDLASAGRNSMPRTHLSSVSRVGITKLRNTSGPVARTSNPAGISSTRSGVPRLPPIAKNSGSFGIRRSSPRGIPCFTQAAIVGDLRVGQPPLADELAEVRCRRATAACTATP